MTIDELRAGIDRIDRQIIGLLNQRYTLVGEVGATKKQYHRPIFVPEREKMLLDKLLDLNAGPLPAEALCAIYREIISGAVKLEQPLTVGTVLTADFDRAAVRTKFGHGVTIENFSTLMELFAALDRHNINYVAVPETPAIWVVLNQFPAQIIAEYYYAPSSRALVIGQQTTSPTGSDQTAIVLPASVSEAQIAALWGEVVRETLAVPDSKWQVIKVNLHANAPEFQAKWEQFQVVAPDARQVGSYPVETPPECR